MRRPKEATAVGRNEIQHHALPGWTIVARHKRASRGLCRPNTTVGFTCDQPQKVSKGNGRGVRISRIQSFLPILRCPSLTRREPKNAGGDRNGPGGKVKRGEGPILHRGDHSGAGAPARPWPDVPRSQGLYMPHAQFLFLLSFVGLLTFVTAGTKF